MNKDERSFGQRFKVWFGMGALMFGTYCGGSTAAGAYATGYFNRYGGGHMLLMLLIFFVIMGVCCAVALDFIRAYKVYNFRDFYLELYGINKPEANTVLKKIVTIFFDIYQILNFLLACGACVALLSSLLNTLFGIPLALGGVISVVVFTIIAIRGAGFIRRFNGAMTISITAILVVILICVVRIRGDVLSTYLGSFEIGKDWTDVPINAGYKNFLSFCMMSFAWGSVMCNYAQNVRTKKDAWMSGLLIGIMCTLLLLLTCLIVLPFLPEYFLSTPILMITKDYLPKVITVLYWLMIVFATVSTGPGMAFAVANRFKHLWKSEKVAENVKVIVIVVVFFIACYFVSLMGLMAIVQKGFAMMGTIGGPACGIPLFISLFRVYRKDRSEKLQDNVKV